MRHPARIDALWLLALLALVCAPFWVPHPQSGLTGDSFSVTADGKLAFYRLVEIMAARYSGQVTRNREPLTRLMRDWSEWRYQSPVLCLNGPARFPTREEWDSVLRWVATGGQLVLAVPLNSPGLSVPGLSVRVHSAGEVSTGPDEAPDRLQTVLEDPAELVWISQGEIELTAGAARAETLVQIDDALQAVRVPHGVGTVTVVASDFLFTNQSLAFGDQGTAELAWLLLGAAENRRDIVIDESLNTTGVPRVVGLLLVDPLRPVTLQVLIVVLVFGWRGSRRFGPARPSAVSPQRDITAHTDAAGQMQYRTGNGAPLVREYLHQLMSEWRLPQDLQQDSRGLERVAARVSLPVETVLQILKAAEADAREPRLSRRAAAARITELARLRGATGTERS